MGNRTAIAAFILGCGIASTCTLVHAATVSVEPDNHSGVIPNPPGATLSTFRYDGAGGYTSHPVISVFGGSWAPTGTRVFGHRTLSASETSHHWDYLFGAYDCEHDGVCTPNFYVFRVDFATPTTRVRVHTTIRGEMAPDGAELWAFNAAGERIQRCRVYPLNANGPLPTPEYIDAQGLSTDVACGAVIQVKNCAPDADPADCDHVVTANVRRRQADIAYVWFGGRLFHNSYAPVDLLSYEYIAPAQ